MTVNKARRTYVTDVHRSLAKKIGEDGADTLMHYLEEVIPAQIEDKVQFLATKEDVANVRADLKEDIANVKTELANVKLKLSGDIANVKAEVANVRTEVANVRTEVANVKADLTKWMLATIITIALGVLALFLKK